MDINNEKTLNVAKIAAAAAGTAFSIISSARVIKNMNKPDTAITVVEAPVIMKAQLDVLMGLDSPALQLRGMQAMKAGTSAFDEFILSLDSE